MFAALRSCVEGCSLADGEWRVDGKASSGHDSPLPCSWQELCEIEAGQKYTKKLDPDQTANGERSQTRASWDWLADSSSCFTALKITTVGPRERVGVLRSGLQRIQAAKGPQSPLAQWGLK